MFGLVLGLGLRVGGFALGFVTVGIKRRTKGGTGKRRGDSARL